MPSSQVERPINYRRAVLVGPIIDRECDGHTHISVDRAATHNDHRYTDQSKRDRERTISTETGRRPTAPVTALINTFPHVSLSNMTR